MHEYLHVCTLQNYYLHTNGDLIHKSKLSDTYDFEESPFVKTWWKIGLDSRPDVYNMLIRAKMLGVQPERFHQLIEHFKITDEDAQNYIEKFGLAAKMDGDQWCVHTPDFQNLADERA